MRGGPAEAATVKNPAQLLVLTVTRACNLRCSYCPTVKDGWPSLSEADAVLAVRLFAERYGGGDIKLFGGEPLLVPDVVRAVFDEVRRQPRVRRLYLSTNGLGLDQGWLDRIAAEPRAVLTVSWDGNADDHRALRRALPGVPDCVDHLMALRPALLATPRLVLTQTVAPATAGRALENLDHLLALGFWRFNLLPGYYLPWRDEQLAALRKSFDAIGDRVVSRWASGQRFYLRNLFTWSQTPFFNSGLVVDADRTIHPSNVGLSGQLDGLRGHTQVGTLDDPPTAEALAAKGAEVNGLLAQVLPPRVWESTLAVDAELTRLVRRLAPAFDAKRRLEAVA